MGGRALVNRFLIPYSITSAIGMTARNAADADVPEADPQSVTSAARGSSPEVAPHKLRLSHALARLLFR